MIKVNIVGERPPEPAREVTFELRRHAMAHHNKSDAEKAYLIGSVLNDVKLYPIAIDGKTQTIEVRKSDFYALGFSVVVKE